MPTPLFTSTTGKVAAEKANQARRDKKGLTKYLAKLGLEETEISKMLDIAQTYIATPGGTFLSGWFLIDLLDRVGYFNKKPNNSNQQTSYQQFLTNLANNQGFTGILNILQYLTTHSLIGAIQGTATADADLLKAGLFSICMVQAVGGGQGINSLIAPLLTAVK